MRSTSIISNITIESIDQLNELLASGITKFQACTVRISDFRDCDLSSCSFEGCTFNHINPCHFTEVESLSGSNFENGLVLSLDGLEIISAVGISRGDFVSSKFFIHWEFPRHSACSEVICEKLLEEGLSSIDLSLFLGMTDTQRCLTLIANYVKQEDQTVAEAVTNAIEYPEETGKEFIVGQGWIYTDMAIKKEIEGGEQDFSDIAAIKATNKIIDFSNCDLSFANFNGVRFYNVVYFSSTKLEGTTFKGASFSSTIVLSSEEDRAIFENATHPAIVVLLDMSASDCAKLEKAKTAYYDQEYSKANEILVYLSNKLFGSNYRIRAAFGVIAYYFLKTKQKLGDHYFIVEKLCDRPFPDEAIKKLAIEFQLDLFLTLIRSYHSILQSRSDYPALEKNQHEAAIKNQWEDLKKGLLSPQMNVFKKHGSTYLQILKELSILNLKRNKPEENILLLKDFLESKHSALTEFPNRITQLREILADSEHQMRASEYVSKHAKNNAGEKPATDVLVKTTHATTRLSVSMGEKKIHFSVPTCVVPLLFKMAAEAAHARNPVKAMLKKLKQLKLGHQGHQGTASLSSHRGSQLFCQALPATANLCDTKTIQTLRGREQGT